VGKIYPPDHVTGLPPSFKNFTDLVRFVGDREAGLFGYTWGLHRHIERLQEALESVSKDAQVTISTLRQALSTREQELAKAVQAGIKLTQTAEKHEHSAQKAASEKERVAQQALKVQGEKDDLRLQLQSANEDLAVLRRQLARTKKRKREVEQNGGRQRRADAKDVADMQLTGGAAQQRFQEIR
jgi:chromosome segregation ATPase